MTAQNKDFNGTLEDLFFHIYPVHYKDGPCVKTAPQSHKFVSVPPSEYSIVSDIIPDQEVTCQLCKTWSFLKKL